MKPKILFVDDSIHVLNSLRLNLRTHRQVWDMFFACGGIEAVQKLETESFDVLVTDLRMPELDGTELLHIANERYPHMARIVLSGYAEENSALKNMALSHHYLSKPCNTGLLIKTITDLLPCQDVPLSPEMRRLISGLQSLPALSDTYTELQSALKDNNVSIRELCGIMEKDMAMVATVLRVANSPYFGGHSRISSIEYAVQLLGIRTLRSIMITTQLFSKLDQSINPEFSFSKLWDHCIRVAGLTHIISEQERVSQTTCDNCFIADMLHDIGKLVLCVLMPKEFNMVLKILSTDTERTHDIEKQILGASHADIGAYLMSRWGFEQEQIKAVLYHHSESIMKINTPSSIFITHIANIIDHELNESSNQNNYGIEHEKQAIISKYTSNKYDELKFICKNRITEQFLART